MQLGPVFGSRDSWSGLAILADTYSNHNGPHNHQHPYLSALVIIKIFGIKDDNCSIFRLIMAVFSMIMTEMEHIKLWEDVSLNLETKIMKH